MANAEDNCTGRFWEGRFKSQALLDEKALISCMAYVDLNPIRAGIAETPETSAFTSIQQRIIQSSPVNTQPEAISLDNVIPKLLHFNSQLDNDRGLPCELNDYIALVDWSGRAMHSTKHGKINDEIPPILDRLGINPTYLLHYLKRKEQGFIHVIGTSASIKSAAGKLGRKFLKGISAANQLFPQPI